MTNRFSFGRIAIVVTAVVGAVWFWAFHPAQIADEPKPAAPSSRAHVANGSPMNGRPVALRPGLPPDKGINWAEAAAADSYLELYQRLAGSDTGAHRALATKLYLFCALVASNADIMPPYRPAAAHPITQDLVQRAKVGKLASQKCKEVYVGGSFYRKYPITSEETTLGRRLATLKLDTLHDIQLLRELVEAGRWEWIEPRAVFYADVFSPVGTDQEDVLQLYGKMATAQLAMCELDSALCTPNGFLWQEACINFGLCNTDASVGQLHDAAFRELGLNPDSLRTAAMALAAMFKQPESANALVTAQWQRRYGAGVGHKNK